MEKGKKRSSHKKEIEGASSATLILRHGGIAVGISFGVALLLSLAFSGIAYATDDPDRLCASLGWAALYFSALFAGFLGVRLHRKDALRIGLFAGALWILLTLVLSLFLQGEEIVPLSFLSSLLPRGLLLLSSVAGGFLGLPRAGSSHGKRRKKR